MKLFVFSFFLAVISTLATSDVEFTVSKSKDESICIPINDVHLSAVATIGKMYHLFETLEDKEEKEIIRLAYLRMWKDALLVVDLFQKYNCWEYVEVFKGGSK